MTTTAALARCTFKGCPVRYRAGPDHPCADHGRADWAVHDAARELGIDLDDLGELAQMAPGDRDGTAET